MRIFILICGIILVLWALWIPLGRSIDLKPPEFTLDVKQNIIVDSLCHRNIIAMQPYMVNEDYASEGHFYEKLKGYFEEAKLAGYIKSNTVVLLPEYLGTWLVISGEKLSVSEIGSINGAMTLIILSNPLKFVKSIFANQNEDDAIAAVIFRMKANEMAKIYAEVFKELAVNYGVTIGAGSIVLPGPEIDNNRIHVNIDQPLYNASFIFNPNGSIDARIIKKSFPIASELPFIKASPLDALPVFDLPIGKTVVLVCADSWYPESYQKISALGAEVVLVNSFCTGTNSMSSKWKGYDGMSEPADVNILDIGTLTENEAWIKYGLPGRLKQSKATIGVNVFLRGKLWNLGNDGQPLIVKDGQLLEIEKSNRGGIWNLCF